MTDECGRDENDGTTCGRDVPVGDRGQRFEVRYLDGDNVVRIMGWTDYQSRVIAMKRAIRLHPEWHSGHVVDRHPGREPIPHGKGSAKGRAERLSVRRLMKGALPRAP